MKTDNNQPRQEAVSSEAESSYVLRVLNEKIQSNKEKLSQLSKRPTGSPSTKAIIEMIKGQVKDLESAIAQLTHKESTEIDWIPLSSRFPEIKKIYSINEFSEEVQVYDKVLGVNQAWLKRFTYDGCDHKKGDWIFENMYGEYHNVTHWKPLP